MSNRSQCSTVMAFVVLAGIFIASAADPARDVRAFGAKGDGSTLDSPAIQRAIDAATANGGGTVLVSPGTYRCGTIELKSGVYLRLEAGATLLGSPDDKDFERPEPRTFKNDADDETALFRYALIRAENAQRIGIVGEGTVNSNYTKRHGPKTIALKRCQFVDIKGVHLINAPNYNISLLGTDNVNIDGVTILNGYADGIDPDACHEVRISNCHIESRDDAIVPKTSFSLGERRSCENIVVTNCYLASRANCFKLGTESGGDFKYITVSNCVMTNFSADMEGGNHATSGISLESVDGANVDGVTITNISMYNACCPIFIRLGARQRDNYTTPGSIRNVIISNVVAQNASWTSSITGIPGAYPEGITLSDIRLNYTAGGPLEAMKNPVPEVEKQYPTANMFGTLPAYGLYCRHAKDIVLRNVQLKRDENYIRIPASMKKRNGNVYWQSPDGKPDLSLRADAGTALIAEDVNGFDIDALTADASKEGKPVMCFADVQNALIRGCRAPEHTAVFLEAAGPKSSGIALSENDLRTAKTAVRKGKDLSRRAAIKH